MLLHLFALLSGFLLQDLTSLEWKVRIDACDCVLITTSALHGSTRSPYCSKLHSVYITSVPKTSDWHHEPVRTTAETSGSLQHLENFWFASDLPGLVWPLRSAWRRHCTRLGRFSTHLVRINEILEVTNPEERGFPWLMPDRKLTQGHSRVSTTCFSTSLLNFSLTTLLSTERMPVCGRA